MSSTTTGLQLHNDGGLQTAGEGSLAGTRGNGEVAPFSAIRVGAMEPRVRRLREIWARAQDHRVADETVIRTRPRTGRRLAHVNSSSSLFASFRSAVSNPSMNQP